MTVMTRNRPNSELLDSRQLLRALRAMRKGDFGVRLPSDQDGLGGEIFEAFNDVVEMNEKMARELERIGKVVGKEGKIAQRASLGQVEGSWAVCVDSVNMLITDLGQPMTEMTRVITAVARGDLSQTMALEIEGKPLKGEFLRTVRTVNTMVDQLGAFASEVIRVAREVGLEGKLGGQAQVKGASGFWKDLTDNVNLMASNLTAQVRDISRVSTSVANGDLSQKIVVDVKGEFLELKQTINKMVDNLNTFSGEVTRVAREVGIEGKLGGQAEVKGVAGTWKALTDNVNMMASNLTSQVRNIAEVTKAVAQGDLSKKITVDVKGEILELKNTVNTMVDQLGSFASEVTRVAREVGTEGKLGGQAEVKGVSGTWKDLTDSVNSMAANLTAQVRNIAGVTKAVASGDLSKKITVDVKGEILDLKDTINTMVDQLSSFASEVTRVAREVGTEGKLGGQAFVKGVSGTWKDLTDNVNSMASNLTGQVRNIADVTTAVANGDLSRKITVDVKGEILELKNTINTMVDQLSSFGAEVTRVAREVGTEGKLGGQAEVKGVSGTWKDLTDSVNSMAGNLTAQVRNIAEVTTAVANGDLSRKITVESKGEILQLKNTINKMVDYLNQLANEVGRVTRTAGEEGKLTEQTSRAYVEGATGAWKNIVDTLNFLLDSIAMPVTEIGRVVTAISQGDLSQKMPFRWKNELAVSRGDPAQQKMEIKAAGDIKAMAETINQLVDDLNTFGGEVTRMAREVGTEGILGGQAKVPGIAGTWKDLTDSVNSMASNLTGQVRDIAKVATAVANGDLSQAISVDVKGEFLELKQTINKMVVNLNTFSSEVTRVAREVGTEGKLGGQAQVQGVAGTWKDLTDNVNLMASNLTWQVRNIAEVTTAVATGDLSKKITVDVKGEILELKNTINTMVDQLNSFASEVTRVAKEVGTDGKLGGQAEVRGVSGVWRDLTDNVNSMASNLTSQVRNIAEVTTAVATGDLSKKITVDVKGEILELKDTINTMVDQLSSFASEVTRVAREVGTEGKLGGQAQVKGVAGTWKDLTDNVNLMANNLTAQVRGIAKVVTGVANGDLKQKLLLEAKGEIAALADTINGMIDTLAIFADQVTTVAREVGVEGKLGGQAKVPGAAGTWRDLTDNVNRLAANLSTQVRAIADVATAVTKGDLTRSITVEVQGEVASLKDNINEMIRNLKETTLKNSEQDWLKTNLAKFSRMLQGQKDLMAVSRLILSELAPLVSAQHGVFYMYDGQEGEGVLKLLASYAYKERKSLANSFKQGEGLVGQCALEKQRILVREAPVDYIQISSGLGEYRPLDIIVLPVLFEGQVKAVVELATFNRFSEIHLSFLDQLTDSIGIVLNTLSATMRTEELLKQSQSLAHELQTQQEELRESNDRLEQQAATLRRSEELLKKQQEELQSTNEELQDKAQLLADQKRQVEGKNREVELARVSLEEKAGQLALTSKYKSEFLANMSHELRTPLNSMLILTKMMAENPDGNLSSKQVEFAKTIHSSGADLLSLINDILDLSKIESGTVSVEINEVVLSEIKEFAQQSFRQVAESKGLTFSFEIDEEAPYALLTDPVRLKQVLKNLLSNAFKFTERGQVKLSIQKAESGWNKDNQILNQAQTVLSFSVSDTGIGIPEEKQKIIFEAFHQADGTTSRRYGGTGLGLSISREIARLLGGDLGLTSTPGDGSTFVLYLPLSYVVPPKAVPKEGWSPIAQSQSKVHYPVSATRFESDPLLLAQSEVKDDRHNIEPGDRVLLVIEDDIGFAHLLAELAHSKDFKVVVALQGEQALALARKFKPQAITLDLRLPGIDGWTVLDRLKHDAETRHIPIHVISVLAQEYRARSMGAFACLEKSTSKESLEEAIEQIKAHIESKPNSLLLVVADEEQRRRMVEIVGAEDIETVEVSSGEEALAELKKKRFDCLVLDQSLPDLTWPELMNEITHELGIKDLPVILYSTRDISQEEKTALNKASEGLIIKEVRSLERLLDETALFLHRVQASLPNPQQQILERIRQSDPVLAGRKVLIVDDDMRNIFSMASALERHDMDVLYAENGRDALNLLDSNPEIDVVLMDIMMPGMDGYETMSAIREMERFSSLPIIAVTAKAMKGDREKCVDAGASDYIAKPLDIDQLLSLLRVWLYR
jgi:HAMP domain-containing protein/signal transduction histidine kinase/CheY-like chemotaxis protein